MEPGCGAHGGLETLAFGYPQNGNSCTATREREPARVRGRLRHGKRCGAAGIDRRRVMGSVKVTLKNGAVRDFKESRSGGSYSNSVRYEGVFVVVADVWGTETAF